MLKVAFDVGGVLTRHPEITTELVKALEESKRFLLYILTDIPKDSAIEMLKLNNLCPYPFHPDRIISVNYNSEGEGCKAKIINQLGIDIHIDDHLGYLMNANCFGLFVMPIPNKPYYSPNWNQKK